VNITIQQTAKIRELLKATKEYLKHYPDSEAKRHIENKLIDADTVLVQVIILNKEKPE
jgi:hypothetical protein